MTFKGYTLKIEVNIFDFDNEIYGEQLELLFISYMRAEMKFDSLEALKEQLHQDAIQTKRLLNQLQ